MSKQRAMRIAQKMGVTFEVSIIGDSKEVTADAPKGSKFLANDAHWIISNNSWEDMSMPEIWNDIAEQIQHGLIPCEDDECDNCTEGN